MPCNNWLWGLIGLFASLAGARGASGGAAGGETAIYHHRHHRVIQGKDPDSLFGYSIAFQENMKEMLIGAPQQSQTGEVYLCPIVEPGECQLVDHDILRNDSRPPFWFGATVNTGENFYMACAPRYITISRSADTFTSTYGHCYYTEAKKKPSWQEFVYGNTDDHKRELYHKAAYGVESKKPEELTDTFGLSSYVYDKKVIFVGGPIMSIGRVYQYKKNDKNNDMILVHNNRLKENKVSYNFGYSITSGYFATANKETIAISSTYGTKGFGIVYFYDYNQEMNDKRQQLFTNLFVKEETLDKSVVKVGSLFGACLGSVLRHDKKKSSALLVGAPAYANSGYDIGAVFIYIFERSIPINKPKLLRILLPFHEDNNGGRFGASITTIGDFHNKKVVAIAAPYEYDGRGAVYLYDGHALLSNTGESRLRYIQRLLPDGTTRSFGLSLTALNDADENGCNEIAIGAPLNSSVTYMPCIASVNVEMENVKYPDLTKQFEELKSKDTAFTFTPCLKIMYKKKPDPSKIETSVKFTIKVIHPDVKLESGDNNGTTKTINGNLKQSPDNKLCHNGLNVLLPKEADYDQNLMFELSMVLDQNPYESEFNPNLVLLNNGRVNYFKQFKGPVLPESNVNFTLRTTVKEPYIIGSTDEEELVIRISNSGQTAHRLCVRTRLNGIKVSKMPTDYCSINVADDELICHIDKLRSGQSEVMNITLSMKSLSSADDRLELTSELFTSNCRIRAEEKKNITVILTKDANVGIKNISIPSFFVNASKEELEFGGKSIVHLYKITNNGFTVWKNLSCEIALPPQVATEKVTIKPTKPETENCVIVEHTAYCALPELGKKSVDVRIQMKIEPGSDFAAQIKKRKATVDTKLTLKLLNVMLVRTTTVVTLWEGAKVALWMIVVACLVSFMIIVILLWVLYECGCLRRQNKQKLEELKQNVHRQSMRKSMMLRQSVIEVIHNDESGKKGEREHLLKVPEEDTYSTDIEPQNSVSQPTSKKDTNGQLAEDKTNVQETQQNMSKEKDVNGKEAPQNISKGKDFSERQEPKDNDAQQTKQTPDLVNVKPVKEICFDDNDPARVALNAELAKAFAKGAKSGVTKADVH